MTKTNRKALRQIGSAVKKGLEHAFQGKDLPAEVSASLEDGRIEEGFEALRGRVQNPFDRTPSDLAKRLVAAQITYVGNDGVVGGIITHAAGYIEPMSDWKKQLLPGREPGLAGVWHSPRRGGYDVGIVTCRQPENDDEFAYVAVWATKVGHDELKMKATAETFGFRGMSGENIADGNNCLLFLPNEDNQRTRLGRAYKVKRLRERSKGPGCKESYKLISA